jgi:hypothetical protein
VLVLLSTPVIFPGSVGDGVARKGAWGDLRDDNFKDVKVPVNGKDEQYVEQYRFGRAKGASLEGKTTSNTVNNYPVQFIL